MITPGYWFLRSIYRSGNIISVTAIVILSVCVAVAAQSSGGGKTAAIKKVRLQLKWKHQFQFAGYYAAIEKGYYKKAGISVDLLEARNNEEPMDAVLKGEAEFGVGASDIVLLRAKGKPVVVLAPIFQHSPQAIIASQKSDIANIHNLVGKKIMLEPHAADILAYMGDEGVSPSRCIVYPHSFDIGQLLSGEVDAMSVYLTDEPFALQKAGFAYTVISPLSGGIDFYGDNLFTTETMIAEHPELVADFRAASLQGWKYAMEHPDEIIDVILRNYSTRHTREHLQFEAAYMQNYILANVIEIGYTNPGRWEGIIETYRKMGFITTPVSSKGLLYDDYVTPPQTIPWRLIIIFSFVLLVIGGIAFFFFKLSERLKREINEREKIQQALTDREKQLEALNATKDKFFSIVAHDLRSPFQSLLGLSRLIITDMKSIEKEELIAYNRDLNELIENQYELLENLLNWVTLQKNGMNFLPVTITVTNAVDAVLRLLQPAADTKKISIRTNIPKDCIVLADPNMLHSILQNLLHNAIKFSMLGGIVELTVVRQAGDWRFSIKDSGVGMQKADVENVFKIDSVRSTRGTADEKGSGLGLVLCKEMVERHGGSIRVESIINEGTTISFTIPENK